MAGELVPLVMLPRYSTFSGADTFQTIAMDVTAYSSVILNLWRGNITGGSSPTVAFTCQESSDQVTWTDCGGTNTSGFDPGADMEDQALADITKRWFRLVVVLTGAGGGGPNLTCWAVGFLEQRLS